MGPASKVGGSFRDPAGFVFERDGILYRQVDRSSADRYDRLMSSGLYDALIDEGLMIPHQEAPLELALDGAPHRVLRPQRVPFVSYPYEWCFGQLKAAALRTLRIQRVAMAHGMSLRDASGYNIQFVAARPLLIDTLSFDPLVEGKPWVAYRQFCQHFLAPLALMRYRDVRLGQLLRVHIDGIPLDLAAAALPSRARLRPSLLLHLFWHARRQRRRPAAVPASGRRFSEESFRGLLESLERAVRRLSWDPSSSLWVAYYGESESYGKEALARKDEVVATFLDEADAGTVWDLGANTGRYSRMAAARGAYTVAFDSDPAVTEQSFRAAEADGTPNLLPLVVDLSNPSPALGWENRERLSLAERGPADLALALALVHHLTIGGNVPLERLAEFLHGLARWAVVEFVPKTDPMVRELLAVRDDVFPDYTAEGFERAFAARFRIVRREDLSGSERSLYLMCRASG